MRHKSVHRTSPPEALLAYTELTASRGIDLGELKCWGNLLSVYGVGVHGEGISRLERSQRGKGRVERSYREKGEGGKIMEGGKEAGKV